jgi:hypothetical protein
VQKQTLGLPDTPVEDNNRKTAPKKRVRGNYIMKKVKAGLR